MMLAAPKPCSSVAESDETVPIAAIAHAAAALDRTISWAAGFALDPSRLLDLPGLAIQRHEDLEVRWAGAAQPPQDQCGGGSAEPAVRTKMSRLDGDLIQAHLLQPLGVLGRECSLVTHLRPPRVSWDSLMATCFEPGCLTARPNRTRLALLSINCCSSTLS